MVRFAVLDLPTADATLAELHPRVALESHPLVALQHSELWLGSTQCCGANMMLMAIPVYHSVNCNEQGRISIRAQFFKVLR